MKKQNYFFSCILFIFLISSNSFALGKAASMGNMQSIVPSGPFDAARNPALLPLQSSDNSTGIFYTYIMHFSRKNSANYDQHLNQTTPFTFDSDINSNISIDDPKIYGMSGRIANVTKSTKYAFGLAVVDNGNDQYLKTEEKTSREEIGEDGIMIINKKSESSKTTAFNPALVTSLGMNISNKSFIGFQLILTYSATKEEKKVFSELYMGSLPPPPLVDQFYEERNKETMKISSELGFGYLYKNNETQIGLLLKTGELSWTEKKINVCRDTIYPVPNTLNADSTVKMKGKYTAGPGIVAGAYKKINPIFGIALESGIEITNSYIDKDLEYNGKNNTIEEQKRTTSINNIYSLKAGIEINPSDNLAIMFGFGYLTGTFESNQYKEIGTSSTNYHYQKKYSAEMDFTYGISTAGIQYIISKNITVDFMTALIPYKKIINMTMREEETDTIAATSRKSYVLVTQKDEGYYLHTGLGVTLSF